MRACARAIAILLACGWSTYVSAQAPAENPPAVPEERRPPAAPAEGASAPPRNERAAAGDTLQPLEPLKAIETKDRTSHARVTKGSGNLPNDDGQIYREYDISPYTLRVTSTNRPEQALVDWILRETGYEAWHGTPLAFLSADIRNHMLRVYHTPQMQATVAELVDRFVNSEAESHAFSVRVISVDNPNWRVRALSFMKPLAVESQGIQAWLLEKEDATLLMAELRRRSDFREHSAPQLLVNNGQATVVSSTRERRYVRGIIAKPEVWPGYDTDYGQIDEGFSFELSPLLSLDGRTIDAILKCNIDQVERLISVPVEVPTTVAPRQQTKVEVPQISQVRVHERFRWPTEQVLLVGLGVVATPTAEGTGGLLKWAVPFAQGPSRADLLLFVESKGKTGLAPRVGGGNDRGTASSNVSRGRY